MNRLRCIVLIPAVLSLTALGCSTTEGGAGGTETDTEGTSSSGGADGAMTTVQMTTVSETSNGSADGTTDSGPPTTGDPSTDGGSSGDATSAGSESTGGGDECTPCVVENCPDRLAACLDDPDCECWLDCTSAGGRFPDCSDKCGGRPPGELFDFIDCVDDACDAQCNGGGSTGGSTTGGADGSYEECAGNGECDDPLQCNMFVNYCSIECQGDDDACPIPSTGDAVPECSDFSDNCILPCNGGATCPDGMTCQNLGGGNQLCAY